MDRISLRLRLARIAIGTALMAAAVLVGARMLPAFIASTPRRVTAESAAPPFATAPGANVAAYEKLIGQPSTRTMAHYYERRAYSGAPPYIPHPLLSPKTWGGAACLSCHRDGGYTPQFRAMAPVTPHPELVACVQCHVPRDEAAGLFRRSAFVAAAEPALDQSAMPGSPPPIPHSLALRDNCLACHAGPSAPAAIRTDHPERAACRQCHASNADPTVQPFERGRP